MSQLLLEHQRGCQGKGFGDGIDAENGVAGDNVFVASWRRSCVVELESPVVEGVDRVGT